VNKISVPASKSTRGINSNLSFASAISEVTITSPADSVVCEITIKGKKKSKLYKFFISFYFYILKVNNLYLINIKN
jgi:hypothetical protein